MSRITPAALSCIASLLTATASGPTAADSPTFAHDAEYPDEGPARGGPYEGIENL